MLIVVAAVWADARFLRSAPPETQAYHRKVREVAEALPLHVGDWFGADQPVPQGAIRILHPNVIISRQYSNISTGEKVSFLLVQVQDARDILGHFPPVCYPGQGWNLDSSRPLSMRVADVQVNGTRYAFSTIRGGREIDIGIDNTLLLPNGTTCPDMDAVYETARNNRLKFFGAGQIQVLYDDSISEQRRDELFRLFVQHSLPVIEQMRTGVEHP